MARKADPRDRRTKLAALTTAGRRACQDGIRLQQETVRDLLRRFTRGEAEQLGALLAKMGNARG